MSKDKVTNFVGINEKIAENIRVSANTNAIEKVVEKRVDAEVIRRADLLEKGLDKYNTTKKDLDKCKPDLTSYGVIENPNGDESGTAIKQSAYSAKRYEEKQKLLKLIADLDVAFMKAFSEKLDEINDGYSRLQKLVSGGGGKPEKQNEPEE